MTAAADDTSTGIEVGAKAGLPTSKQTCPWCGTTGQAQQLVDGSDHPGEGPTPYGCHSCGCEFVD